MTMAWDATPQRMLAAYRVACVVVFSLALVWFGVFAANEMWPLASFEIGLALVALISWILLRTSQLAAALLFSELAFLFLTVVFCLAFDVSSDGAPRVSHLFLLVLAMLSYIGYLRSNSVFQLAILSACLVFFVVFASTNYAFPFARPISDEFRVLGAWFNVIVATALLCLCMRVMQIEITRQKGMARSLRTAVQNDQLELYYQPVVDREGDVVGAEALLRWKHPTRGFVSPAEFIPVAEENGLMPALGAWVLNSTCRTLARWQDDPELSELRLGVNVSVEQFKDDGFERFVLETLAVQGVDASKLTFELTESVVISDHEKMVPCMNRLRATGIRFAIDDFGTGYSSLSYLRTLPFDDIKIDRSFVHEGLDTPRGNALVQSIVKIGQDLGMTVIAEGVETQEQYALLRSSGCHKFQGYLFSRPIPRDDFEAHFRTRAGEIRWRPVA